MSTSQAAHVVALVSERHNSVKKSFDALLNAYAVGEQSGIITANENLRSNVSALQSVVAVEHWPDWLKDISSNVERYATRHSNGLATWRAHLNSAIENASSLYSESWSFSEHQEVLFDVDAIIEKAKAQHNVDGLYINVTACLEAILKSGEVDSVKASLDLRNIISSLQKARIGSFASQTLNWNFARRLIPNILSSYIKRNGVIGPLVEAFEQTAAELDVSLDRTKDQIGQDILAAAASTLRTDTASQITADLFIRLEDRSSDRSKREL